MKVDPGLVEPSAQTKRLQELLAENAIPTIDPLEIRRQIHPLGPGVFADNQGLDICRNQQTQLSHIDDCLIVGK
jgi:hypothetical protein